jgi:hypothetical protein
MVARTSAGMRRTNSLARPGRESVMRWLVAVGVATPERRRWNWSGADPDDNHRQWDADPERTANNVRKCRKQN